MVVEIGFGSIIIVFVVILCVGAVVVIRNGNIVGNVLFVVDFVQHRHPWLFHGIVVVVDVFVVGVGFVVGIVVGAVAVSLLASGSVLLL